MCLTIQIEQTRIVVASCKTHFKGLASALVPEINDKKFNCK